MGRRGVMPFAASQVVRTELTILCPGAAAEPLQRRKQRRTCSPGVGLRP